jgi:ATP-dependent DNA ligase
MLLKMGKKQRRETGPSGASTFDRSLPGPTQRRPGDRRLWWKTKCLNEDEFIRVGWSDPEGSRPYLGSLLLGYYDDAGRLLYAGRAGSGISDAELDRLWRRLQPLAVERHKRSKLNGVARPRT